MAVSKRARFEILRRDSHACQYCGQMAPDVVLHIDHVIPVALGGSDKPDNLVTACKDCNAGKSSISPDSPIVAAVGARSAEYVLAMSNRAAHMEADFADMEHYEETFWCRWDDWGFGQGEERKSVTLPLDWRRSLKIWWGLKVPLNVLSHAVEVTMTTRTVKVDDKFRYFAGVVWRAIDDYDLRYPAEMNSGHVFSPSEFDEHGMDEWRMGYEAGEKRQAEADAKRDLVQHHIDAGLLVA